MINERGQAEAEMLFGFFVVAGILCVVVGAIGREESMIGMGVFLLLIPIFCVLLVVLENADKKKRAEGYKSNQRRGHVYNHIKEQILATKQRRYQPVKHTKYDGGGILRYVAKEVRARTPRIWR